MYPGDGRPRGEIETFVASEGHVTGWHTDFQHNFTFQLRGAKRWRFKAGPVKNNVRALTPHFQTRSNFEQQMKLHLLSDPTEPVFRPPDDFFADAEEVELHAGSVLYHPAGIWHHVECLGEEESISINVSLSIATWADLEPCQNRLCRERLRGPGSTRRKELRSAMPCVSFSGLRPACGSLWWVWTLWIHRVSDKLSLGPSMSAVGHLTKP
ncbi:jcdD [Symbiodinium necroappetens]|uniref:JcdD protein n=1 Tax=Symbiodinium necroappetens TaxID=1628268 RepID=A0A813BMK1_9DINO|nr:jcdD [Symbiodinium necroappetens]